MSEKEKQDRQYTPSLKALALLRDPELYRNNPHLNDYRGVLLEPVLEYVSALRQIKSEKSRISANAGAIAEIMSPKIARLCTIVNGLHSLDAIRAKGIPNKTFAESRLIPLIVSSYNQFSIFNC